MSTHALRPWQVSFVTHTLVVGGLCALTFIETTPPEFIEVPVVESVPVEAQSLEKVEEKPKVVLKSVNTPEQAPAKVAREVFGASRNSYTDSEGGVVEAKKGNTLAKEADKEVLKDSDADALPAPTAAYLVSEMPSVLSEVRPEYPKAARDQKIQGPFVMDVLIDGAGKVRQVSAVEGNDIFREAALAAMQKFKFRPALVDGKPVAVKIRYTLRFELEY